MIAQVSDTGGLMQNSMWKIGGKILKSIRVQAFPRCWNLADLEKANCLRPPASCGFPLLTIMGSDIGLDIPLAG